MADNGDFLKPNEQETAGLSNIATGIITDIACRQFPDVFGQTGIFDYHPDLYKVNPKALLPHLINEEFQENVSAFSTVSVGDRNFAVVISGGWEDARGFDISFRAFPLTAEEMKVLSEEKPTDLKEDVFLMAVNKLNRNLSVRDSSVRMFWHRTADKVGLWKPNASFSKDLATYKQQEDLLKALAESDKTGCTNTLIKNSKRELIGVRNT